MTPPTDYRARLAAYVAAYDAICALPPDVDDETRIAALNRCREVAMEPNDLGPRLRELLAYVERLEAALREITETSVWEGFEEVRRIAFTALGEESTP